MAVISIASAQSYAAAAGFTGEALNIIVAIAQAESGLDTTAVNANDPNGGSFGIVQINGIHIFTEHAITLAQAYDPAAAFRFAYHLSNGGQNFTPWSTYTSGAYTTTQAWKQGGVGQSAAAAAAGGAVSNGLLWSPAKSRATWPWLTSDGIHLNINNPYNPANGEMGIDTPTTFHTSITSLTSGHVIRAFYGTDINPDYGYGGVVLVAAVLPGHPGAQAVYYQHLDQIDVKAGDVITVGQHLGLSGGQTSGGEHPNTPRFSSGPHTEVGVNSPYYAAQGGAPGPNFDPTPWLSNLIKNGPPATDQLGSAAQDLTGRYAAYALAYTQALSNQLASGTGPVGDNFAAIESRIDTSMQFVPIDWQTLTNQVHWWQIFLPWTWQNAADQVATNLSTAVSHNAAAMLLRGLVMLIGVIILIAFIFGVVSSVAKATGADQAASEAIKIANTAALAAAAGG